MTTRPIDYIFYLRNPGFGNSWKCGISSISNAWSRLGTYQNAFGPEYKENWKHIFIGESRQIKMLERKFKQRYSDKISGGDAGYSEWITDITEEELLGAVKFFRDECFIKFYDVPDELLPFTSDYVDELKEYVAGLQQS